MSHQDRSTVYPKEILAQDSHFSGSTVEEGGANNREGEYTRGPFVHPCAFLLFSLSQTLANRELLMSGKDEHRA